MIITPNAIVTGMSKIMEDRFKFRAYNPLTKVMHYDVERTYDSYLNCFGSYLIDDIYTEDGDLTNHKWIVMQCTGLKDKNGKLIYEGDIIKYPLHGNRIFSVHLGKYFDELAKHDRLGFHLIPNSGNEILGICPDCFFEIIGNKFENPELLTKETNE